MQEAGNAQGITCRLKMGEGTGTWLKDMPDFEEVRSIQASLMPL